MSSGVYSIPCSCGKFYIGRTHQQFIERFIEHRNSIDNALKFTKPPDSFTSALAEHIFFNSDHFVQFEEATAISNDKGFTQWALEALEIKKHIFAGLSINRDTGNINIDPIYDTILKNEPIFKNKNKVLQNVPGVSSNNKPKRIAASKALHKIMSQ